MYHDAPNHILPLAKPMYLAADGSDTGVVLVHGFADSPYSMRSLAKSIHEWGYSVMVVRLPGHGSRITDLQQCTLSDWQEGVAEAVSELSKTVRRVVLVGRSFGGVLALHEAVTRPDGVAGVVLISTPHTVRKAWLYAAVVPWLKYILPRVKKRWAKRDEYVMRLEVGRYPEFSLAALQQLFAGFRTVRKEVLAGYTKPLLVIQGSHDTKGNPASAAYFMESVASTNKTLVWLDGVGHEPEEVHHHPKTLSAIRDFLANISHS